jgi:hypothetical protein
MFRLNLSEEEWHTSFGKIHCTFPNDFQQGYRNHWLTNYDAPTNSVNAQAVCWLYCWAHLQNNDARILFNALFDFSYDHAERRIDIEWAREIRYAEGHYDADLTTML